MTNSAPDATSTPVCLYYTQGACWYGDHCRFRHPQANPPSPPSSPPSSPSPAPSFCSCFRRGQVDFVCLPHTRSTVPQPRATGHNNRVLAFVDEELAFTLVEQFDIFHTNGDEILQWTMYSGGNHVTIRFARLPDSSLYQVRGPAAHQLCVLGWLELWWPLFQWSERTHQQRVVPTYLAFHPGSLFLVPSPLRDRLLPLAQRNAAMRASQQRATRKTASPVLTEPWRPSPLDAEEKAFLVSYSQREEDDSEEEEEEDSEEELGEEEEVWDRPRELALQALLHDRLAHMEYPTHLAWDEGKGYQVLSPSSFVPQLESWMSSSSPPSPSPASPSHSHVVLHHAFRASGGFHRLRLHETSDRMMGELTAGCGRSCQLSEVVSFDLLRTLCGEGVDLLHTEMTIQYDVINAPRIDYLLATPHHKVGVSVTRAWNGPATPFTREHAHRLLSKKMRGLDRAHACANHAHQWDRQLLHVWCASPQVALLLQWQWEQLLPSHPLARPTLFLITWTDLTVPAAESFLFRCD